MRLPLFLLGLMLLIGAAMADARAEDAVETVTYLEVTPEAVPGAIALLQRTAVAGRAEDGNRGYAVLQEEGRRNRFALVAAWRDEAARAAHDEAAAAFAKALTPLRLAPRDERVHGGLSLDARRAAPPRRGLWVLTHVDVVPPRKDEAAALLRQLAEESRREPGNRRFDVLQQTSRPNHFTVVEVWADAKAATAHAGAAHTKAFREALGPMQGALYDERLYRAVE